MCFNTLLLSGCFLPGTTSFTEKGTTVSAQPERDETILFFSIDEQSNSSCKLRKILGMDRAGIKICDLLVFYARSDERLLCFVELKGKDSGRAVEQVVSTYKYFKEFLNKSPQESSLMIKIKAKAFIKLSGSAPKELREHQEELKKVFGENNYDCNRATQDFGEFLRGKPRQLRGKRKK